MAKTAAKKPFKATPASKRRSRGDVVRQIATGTGLKPRQVKEVFEGLQALMAADLGKRGPGEFNVLGLIKLRTVNKPATPARKGRNPFTGEEIMIKAKPASRKVRARALRAAQRPDLDLDRSVRPRAAGQPPRSGGPAVLAFARLHSRNPLQEGCRHDQAAHGLRSSGCRSSLPPARRRLRPRRARPDDEVVIRGLSSKYADAHSTRVTRPRSRRW